MKRLLFLPRALALAAAAQANSPGAALTAQQISDQATAESSSLQTIERQPDGRVRMTAPMQAMEALIGPDGMELRSVNAGGEAAFGWRLEAVGRASGSQTIPPFFRREARGDAREARAVADTGKVIIEGERVAVLRPQAIEEFTASADILTGIGVGTCTVTATKDGDADYRPSSDSVDVTVFPAGNGVFTDRFEGL